MRGLPGWTADYPDPDGFFRGFFAAGWPFYSDDEIEELLDQARSLGNQDERMRLYHEIDRIWVTERAGDPAARLRPDDAPPATLGRVGLGEPAPARHLDQAVVKRS